MVVDFSVVDFNEKPTLILKNTTGTPIGVLGAATKVTADIKYNESSVLEFNLPAKTDGVDTPYYNSVIGMRVVDLQNIGQFILMNPKETGDGIKKIKSCRAYSLEYEFTFKKITLENGTYNFWNPTTPDSTLLGMILELMPSWSVGSVDSSLIGKYRTFEVNEENLYNFIKSTAQQSYNCIFDFDTYNRRVNVKDVSSSVPVNPVYISFDNLAKEVTLEENTEDIITRLDVNGADGVTIRDVNPSGTNQIINLDYFMTTDNFDSALINKYYAWKSTYTSYQKQYYNISIEYGLQSMRKATANAELTELQGELTSLENIQAVVIQSIAKGLMGQSDLNKANKDIADKQKEIKSKEDEISSIEVEMSSIYNELVAINKKANFRSYFTEREYLILDRYIKDESVQESSFVVKETVSYEDGDVGKQLSNTSFKITNATITNVTNAHNKDIYDIKGGKLTVGSLVSADVISAAFEKSVDNSFVMTAYLSQGEYETASYKTACISMTGTVGQVIHNMKNSADMPMLYQGTEITVRAISAYMYFTLNTGEYEKRAVAWELYEYGSEILEKMSQPSYTFSITSANFLHLDDFVVFKNKIKNGEKLYTSLGEDKTLAPIAIGMNIDYDDWSHLTLEFSDTYISSDSAFRLADLLEQSVSMGKNVDLSKFTYSAFVDSGASTKVKDFMDTALDVAKNAILSSKDQAITWGDSGIRMRKWANADHTSYEPCEVWLNNNSIMMTSNNWSTAEIAIGNFYDANLGSCWGIVAPNIVGTLLAGSSLVIESAKKDGGVAVFRVDADGCVLHNSIFSITSALTKTHILLDPDNGIAIGDYPLIDSSGKIDEDKYKFWVDRTGNLFFRGTLKATNGEFDGKVTAREGYIGNGSAGWTIGDTFIYNGKSSYEGTTKGIYIGTDGISIGSSTRYVKIDNAGNLTANNVDITGKITATSGYIGGTTGWTIGSTYIYNGKSSFSSTALGVYIGTNGIHLGGSESGEYSFKVTNKGVLTATSATITGKITATSGSIGSGSTVWTIGSGAIYNGKSSYANTTSGIYIGVDGISFGDATHYFKATSAGQVLANYIYATGGEIGGWTINGGKIYAGDGDSVKTAVMQAPSSSITWVFAAGGASHSSYSDCPFRVDKEGNLVANAATIRGSITATSGTIGGCSISDGTLQIAAANITSGTIASARIPNLSADKITSGTLDANNVTIANLTVSAAQITSGTISSARIPNLSANKITSGTLDANNVTIANLTVSAAQITSGTISSARIGTLSADKISGGTLSGCSINISNGKFQVTSSGTIYINSGKTIYVYDDTAGTHTGWHYGLTTSIPYMNNTIDQWLMYFAQGIMIGFGNNGDWIFG